MLQRTSVSRSQVAASEYVDRNAIRHPITHSVRTPALSWQAAADRLYAVFTQNGDKTRISAHEKGRESR